MNHDFEPAVVQSNLNQIASTDLPLEITTEDAELRIVIALHPQCPCSRLTLTELERLLPSASKTIAITTLAYIPTRKFGTDVSSPELNKWMDTESIDLIRRFPNSRILHDPDGAIASKFDLNVSGAIAILDQSNQVIFRGGITASRSCAAENLGGQTLLKIISNQPFVPTSTPVFGCVLGN